MYGFSFQFCLGKRKNLFLYLGSSFLHSLEQDLDRQWPHLSNIIHLCVPQSHSNYIIETKNSIRLLFMKFIHRRKNCNWTFFTTLNFSSTCCRKNSSGFNFGICRLNSDGHYIYRFLSPLNVKLFVQSKYAMVNWICQLRSKCWLNQMKTLCS